MADVTVRLGRKAEEESKVDRTLIARGDKPRGRPDGGIGEGANVACWNCYAINTIAPGTARYDYFYCWNCGALCQV